MTMLRIVRTFYQVLILPLSRFFSSLSKTLDLTYFFNMAGAEGLLCPFGIMVASLPYDNASHCSNLLSGSHPSAISFLFQLKEILFYLFSDMAGAEGLLCPFGIMVALLPYDNASHCSNLLSGSHPSAISFLFQLKQDFRSYLFFQYGWGGRIRTFECGDQNPVPCRLATPQ